MTHLEYFSKKQGSFLDHQKTALFIQDIGQRLYLNQVCINTAIVYMHKFYAKFSFTDVNKYNLSLAALYIAGNCIQPEQQQQYRHLADLIKIGHARLHKGSAALEVTSKAFTVKKLNVNSCIELLLRTLGFHLTIDHLLTYVLRVCTLLKASKDVVQVSDFLAATSLHVTTMCLQYPPAVVACVCIHLACKWTCNEIAPNSEGKEWYHYVDKSVTSDLLETLEAQLVMNLKGYQYINSTKSIAVKEGSWRSPTNGDSFEDKNIAIKEVSRVPSGDKVVSPKIDVCEKLPISAVPVQSLPFKMEGSWHRLSNGDCLEDKNIAIKEVSLVPAGDKAVPAEIDVCEKLPISAVPVQSLPFKKEGSWHSPTNGDSLEDKNIAIKDVSWVPAGDKAVPPKIDVCEKFPISAVPVQSLPFKKEGSWHRPTNGDCLEDKNIAIKEVSRVPAGDKAAPAEIDVCEKLPISAVPVQSLPFKKEGSNHEGGNAAVDSSKHQFSESKVVPVKKILPPVLQVPPSARRLSIDAYRSKRKRECLEPVPSPVTSNKRMIKECNRGPLMVKIRKDLVNLQTLNKKSLPTDKNVAINIEGSNHGRGNAAAGSSKHQFPKSKVVPVKKILLPVLKGPSSSRQLSTDAYRAKKKRECLNPVPSSVASNKSTMKECNRESIIMKLRRNMGIWKVIACTTV